MIEERKEGMTPSMYPRRGGMHREERPQPKNLAEFFKYLFGAVKSFLSRLYYIISLVWQTAPSILIVMVLLCILDGVLPVIGAYISKDLLNEISSLLLIRDTLGDVGKEIFSALRPLFFLFLLQFFFKTS